ncbi:pimeloyl-ACP methyl ester carboxylesterase [Streptomyces phaeoluteigriseus]
MRAAVLHSATGALLLTTLSAVPAGGTPNAVPGVVIAAERAAAEGIDFGACTDVPELPDSVECGKVGVPLDYARPHGKRIELAVTRVRATQRDPHNSKRRVPRRGALVFNPGGPGASGLYFPLIGMIPEWKRIGAAYDLVGYDPRGVGRSAPAVLRGPEDLLQGARPRPDAPLEDVQAGARRAGEDVRAWLRGAGGRRAAPLQLAEQRP